MIIHPNEPKVKGFFRKIDLIVKSCTIRPKMLELSDNSENSANRLRPPSQKQKGQRSDLCLSVSCNSWRNYGTWGNYHIRPIGQVGYQANLMYNFLDLPLPSSNLATVSFNLVTLAVTFCAEISRSGNSPCTAFTKSA